MVVIKPQGSIGTQITVGGYTLLVSESNREYDVLSFERDEFKHQRLLGAPNSDNTIPRVEEMLVKRIQIGYACGLSDTPRPMTPDDSALSNIYRQFNIVRYRINGAVSDPTQVEGVAGLANTHRQLWQQFQNRQKLSQSGHISYQELVNTFQAETFSYLTATGTSIVGLPVNNGSTTTVTNVLIKQFSLNYDFIVPQTASPGQTIANYIQWKSFTLVAEQLTEAAQTF